MKRKVIVFLVVNSLFFALFIPSKEVRAERDTSETRSVGITFVEESNSPSTPNQPGTPNGPTDGSTIGTFPQTNEKYSRNMLVLGLIILSWSVVIYKKRKNLLNQV